MKLFISLLLSTALFGSVSFGLQPSTLQNVDVSAENEALSLSAEEASPRILTKLVVQVYSPEEGYIGAAVTNQFTLFPSTVPVELWLYSSYTSTTDVTQMTEEGYRTIADLNMGDSLTIQRSTNGEQKYWCAYAIYHVDNNQQEVFQTETVLFSATGMPLSTT